MSAITTTLTRTDCTRDNRKVYCAGASTLGFGLYHCKRGNWLLFEYDNIKRVGRSLGRVVCERKEYIEVATAAEDFSHVYIRWVQPEWVRGIRATAPARVLNFFAISNETWCADVQQLYREMEHGVSDMRDQMGARDADTQ